MYVGLHTGLCNPNPLLSVLILLGPLFSILTYLSTYLGLTLALTLLFRPAVRVSSGPIIVTGCPEATVVEVQNYSSTYSSMDGRGRAVMTAVIKLVIISIKVGTCFLGSVIVETAIAVLAKTIIIDGASHTQDRK